MIAELDPLAAARETVATLRRELQAAENELSSWLESRHTAGGIPVKSLDLVTGRLVDGMAVDTQGFESRENMLRARVEGARCRLKDAEDKFRDIRLAQLVGVKVRVQLFDCVTAKGDELLSSTLVSGVVSNTMGPWAAVRLDRPTMFQAKQVDEIFCRKSRLICSD